MTTGVELSGLDDVDIRRIDELTGFLRTGDTGSVLSRMLPGFAGDLEGYCRLDHAAVLVFPRSKDALAEGLRELGLEAGEPAPSVVVRERLSRRYGRPLAELDVRIFRVPVESDDGEVRELEIFALQAPPGSGFEEIVAGERASGIETHVGFRVVAPDRIVLAGLRTTLLDGGYRPDGGGYNRHVGVTVLYFRNDRHDSPLRRRLELISAGEHPGLLADHDDHPDQSATRLLELMTGAWTTQAIAVAAELGLADRLAEGPIPTSRLAMSTGAHHDSLRRLLRYLAAQGVVKEAGDDYELTELGELLRTDTERSLHPLAVIYGGSFYESFGGLVHSVRTGQEAFEHLFGTNHFDYFAERPELAELFDRAMASSASMFGRVAELVDFSAARVVVDVAGGNGELLGRILRAEPHLSGVLFEREHVIEAARATFDKAGCLDRVELVTGDFTGGVPSGGDVYLLSRVLHDWDDERCRIILDRCAEAMEDGAELLILERLLPEDGSSSLAVAWDLHMMCNVGGRERTTGHYRRLLAGSGFEIASVHGVGLDVALLRAIRRQSGH